MQPPISVIFAVFVFSQPFMDKLAASGTAKARVGKFFESETQILAERGSAVGDEPPVAGNVLFEPATGAFKQLTVIGKQTDCAGLRLQRHDLSDKRPEFANQFVH